MESLQLEIGGRIYVLRFGFGCLRVLSEKWECEGVQQTVNELLRRMSGLKELSPDQQILVPDFGADVPISAIEAFGEVTVAAVRFGSGERLEVDDVCDHLLRQQDLPPKIMEAFIASLPKPNPDDAGKQFPEIAPDQT